MKHLLKAFAASAVLLTLTHQAFAQVTVPPQPAPGPFPTAGGNTANGPLLVTIWNNQGSIVQWLGLNLNQVGDAAMTPDGGLVLDFGIIDEFAATFTNPLSPVFYNVMSARAGTSGFVNNILETTASATPSASNQGLQSAVRVYRDFILNSLNASGGCNGTNACATTDALSQQYAGGFAAGMASNLGFNPSAAIGTPLNFYRLQGAGTSPGALQTGTVFDNATGLGQWLLTSAGHLTYTIAGGTVVPLPAAAWLLLSGIAGFATVSRRKRV